VNSTVTEKVILIKLDAKIAFSALKNPTKAELQAFAKEVFRYRKKTGQTMSDS
jgi:hypothetical protein